MSSEARDSQGPLFHGLLLRDRPCRIQVSDPEEDSGEELLALKRPNMPRGNPLLFFACCALSPLFGIGLLGFLVWGLHDYFVVLSVTRERIVLRRGVFAKTTGEIPIGALHNVDVYQSVIDRLLGVGRLRFSSAGHEGYALNISRMRDPYALKALVDRLAREGRAGRAGMMEVGSDQSSVLCR